MTEMPIRKHKSFIPKFFRLFSFFIIASLCSFFGCIQFFDVIPPQNPVPEDSTDAFEEDPVTELFSSLMGMQNIETDFNLAFENKEISLSAQGNVMFEMDDMAVAVDLDLVYNGAIFDVKAKYLEPNFYLEINENVYKFDTATSGGEFDFDAIMSFVQENFDFDLSAFSDIGKDLGLDFENLDLNSLIAKVSNPEYKELEGGKYSFVFNISNVISAVLVTDANYNIESLNLNEILLKGNRIKFNLSNTRMNQSDIDVSYGETGEEIDLSGINKYIGYFQNTFKNPYVLADIDLTVEDQVYEGKLLYQNDGVQQFKLTTNVEGIDVEIALANNHVYIDACNQKLSFDLDDYAAWEAEINRVVEKHTSKTVVQIINETIYKYTSINPKEMTAEEQAMAILGAFFGNSDKIDAFLPDDTVETENDLKMIWNNGLNITMAQTDSFVTNVKINCSNVECLTDLSIATEGFEIAGEYYDLTNLLPFVNVADEIYSAKQFGGDLTVEYAGEKITTKYRVDFAEDILAEVTLTAFGEDIAIYLSGRDVYVQVGGMVLGGSLDDLKTYIASIEKLLGKEIISEDEAETQDLASVVAQVVAILSDVKLASETGYIAVVEYLASTGYVSIADGKTILSVEIGEIKASLDMLATTGEVIAIPAETDSVEDLLAKVENLKAYVEGKEYAFNFGLEAVVEEEKVALSGTAHVDLANEDFYITNLKLGETELGVNVRYVVSNSTAYVEYQGLKIQAHVDNIMSLAEVVMDVVNANLPQDESETEEQQTDMLTQVLLEIFGEDIRTKSLKEILKSITIDLARNIVVDNETEEVAEDSLTLIANMSSFTPVTATVVVEFNENSVAGARVEYKSVKASVALLEYAMPTLVTADYYDLTSKHTGTVTIKYTKDGQTLDITADVELDLTEGVYFRATTTVAENDIELLVKNDRVTLSVGDFRVGAHFTKASEIWNTISTLFSVSMPESENTEDVDVEEILASVLAVDLSKYVSLTGSTLTVKETTVTDGLTISATLKDEQDFTQTAFADESGEVEIFDINEFLPKAKYVYDYLKSGVYEFDFAMSYNGFPFEGTFKFNNKEPLIDETTGQIAAGQVLKGEMEIVLKDVCGQGNFVIRIRDGVAYISYGNMKVQAPLTQSSGEEIDYKQIINDLLTDAFGINLQFGIFEQFLVMARDYSWKDYIDNLTFTMDYETNKLSLKLFKKLEVSKDWLANLEFNFNGDKLTTIDVDLLDIIEIVDKETNKKSHSSLIDGSLKILDVETSSIPVLSESEYQSYSTNYLDGILDSLKVENAAETGEVYAFSSEIAIRYSTIDFYGNLTAMLVKNEAGEYSPAILVETTALGLQSYIYLIGETIYIDINGLQIKADLNETTINDIMAFVEEELGIALSQEETESQENSIEPLGEAVEAFKVIIPAIDKIYGSWISVVEETSTSYGVQISIDDKLQYAENAFFDDIVIQAFADTFTAETANAQSTIIPTKIVLGANITDANTVPHYEKDYFKDYWLSTGVDENNNPIVIEDGATKQLNFAIYLTNIVVGATNKLNLNSIFGTNLVEISTVKSNYTTSSISDFNHYQNVLDFVDTVYDYGMGLNYQATANVTISNTAGTSTAIGGDVVVKLSELSEEEISNNAFVLFGDKAMKVQGNLSVTNSTGSVVNNKHLIDLLYQSDNNAALYLTYAHDDYTLDTNGNDAKNNNHIQLGNNFQAKINNANMSEIVAMLISLADLSLGEDAEKALGIDDKPCTTDFDYVHSLLGIGSQDVGDDISKVDEILGSVENITKMITNMKLSKTQMINELYETTFEINLNMKYLNEVDIDQIGVVKIVMCEEKATDALGEVIVVRKLRQIVVNNLIYGANTINATINLTDFMENSFDYLTTNPIENHIDFSSLSSFIDVAVSTLNTQNFHFNGEAQVVIDVAFVEIDFTVGINLLASLSEVGELYMYIELDVPCIADVTYDLGGFGSTYTYYSAAMGFDKRISVIEYNGDSLTVTQNTYGFRESGFNKRKDKVKTWYHSASEIGNDIMLIMAEALGFTDKIYEAIKNLIADMNPNPSLEETILGFSYGDTALALAVDGASLTGDTDFEDMDLAIGLSSEYETPSRNFKFIDSISTELVVSIVNIPINLRSLSGNQYTKSYTSKSSDSSTYSKTYYTNNYYRNQYLKKFA